MVCRIPLVSKSCLSPTTNQQLLLSSLLNPGLLLLSSLLNPGQLLLSTELLLSTPQSCNQLARRGLLLQPRLGKIPHFLFEDALLQRLLLLWKSTRRGWPPGNRSTLLQGKR